MDKIDQRNFRPFHVFDGLFFQGEIKSETEVFVFGLRENLYKNI